MTEKYVPFSAAEYARRLSKTRAAMERAGLDAMFVTDPSNQAWLTGYDGWSFYVHQGVIVTHDRDPIWWGRYMDSIGALRTCWMAPASVHGYADNYVQSTVRHPMQDLAGHIRALGLATARIGVEMENYYYSAKAHAVLAGDLPDATLVAEGLDVPRLVAGGSGSFPLYAELNDPALELSPGTVIFFDEGYRSMFPDLNFTPAALLLTRVVSRPTPNRITLDLGYKAVAGDPPAGRRVTLPQLPDGKEVLHNEEHLVIETDQAEQFQPGDCLLAIPRHICPCSALHRSVFVAREGRIRGIWTVAARDRQLSI